MAVSLWTVREIWVEMEKQEGLYVMCVRASIQCLASWLKTDIIAKGPIGFKLPLLPVHCVQSCKISYTITEHKIPPQKRLNKVKLEYKCFSEHFLPWLCDYKQIKIILDHCSGWKVDSEWPKPWGQEERLSAPVQSLSDGHIANVTFIFYLFFSKLSEQRWFKLTVITMCGTFAPLPINSLTAPAVALNADPTTLQLEKNTHQSDHLADKSCENVTTEMPSCDPAVFCPLSLTEPLKIRAGKKNANY